MTELLPNIYAVPVPKEAHSIEDTKADGIMWQMPDGSYDSFYFENEVVAPYKILGTVTEDTIDFDVSEFQHWRDIDGTPENYFHSLLTSKGLNFTNPYDEKMNVNSGIKGSMVRAANQLAYGGKWQTAQSNLIEKLIIIQKI